MIVLMRVVQLAWNARWFIISLIATGVVMRFSPFESARQAADTVMSLSYLFIVVLALCIIIMIIRRWPINKKP